MKEMFIGIPKTEAIATGGLKPALLRNGVPYGLLDLAADVCFGGCVVVDENVPTLENPLWVSVFTAVGAPNGKLKL
jgi:hypothetical protein